MNTGNDPHDLELKEPGFYWFRHDREAVLAGAAARGINVNDPRIAKEIEDEFGWMVVKVDRQGLVWTFGIGAAEMLQSMQMTGQILGRQPRPDEMALHHSRILGEWGERVDRPAIELN